MGWKPATLPAEKRAQYSCAGRQTRLRRNHGRESSSEARTRLGREARGRDEDEREEAGEVECAGAEGGDASPRKPAALGRGRQRRWKSARGEVCGGAVVEAAGLLDVDE